MQNSIRTLWFPTAGPMLVLVACAMLFAPAAGAGPIAYTLNFTTADGLAPSGSFVYDSSQPSGSQFSSFLVSWDDITFDLTSSANAPGGAPGGDCPASAFEFLVNGTDCTDHYPTYPGWFAQVETGVAELFQFMDIDTANVNGIDVYRDYYGVGSDATFADGTWTATAAPEPGSLILALGAGVGLVRLLRAVQPRFNSRFL